MVEMSNGGNMGRPQRLESPTVSITTHNALNSPFDIGIILSLFVKTKEFHTVTNHTRE